MKKPELKMTSDYSLFNTHFENRDVKRTARLEKSIEENGFDPGYPLRVTENPKNGKLLITSGHRRFYVAQKLNKPFYYIVVNTPISLAERERTIDRWTLPDYLISYVRAGDPEAIKLQQYIDRTRIPLNCAVSLCRGHQANSGRDAQLLIDRKYVTGNMKHALDVERVVKLLDEIGVTFCRETPFVKALSQMLLVPEFDIQMFARKARTHPMLWEKCRNTKDYSILLETVMNFQTPVKKRMPWSHIAEQASRSRSIDSPDYIRHQPMKTN